MYDITVKLTVIACAYSESIIYNLIFDLPVTAHIVFIYNDVCNQTLYQLSYPITGMYEYYSKVR